MKKSFWVLLLFILIGLLAGSLLAHSLAGVQGLSFLTKTSLLEWSPAADLVVLSYDVTLGFQVSLLSIVGLILAIWLYRKL